MSPLRDDNSHQTEKKNFATPTLLPPFLVKKSEKSRLSKKQKKKQNALKYLNFNYPVPFLFKQSRSRQGLPGGRHLMVEFSIGRIKAESCLERRGAG